jgi:hypothetical protein
MAETVSKDCSGEEVELKESDCWHYATAANVSVAANSHLFGSSAAFKEEHLFRFSFLHLFAFFVRSALTYSKKQEISAPHQDHRIYLAMHLSRAS